MANFIVSYDLNGSTPTHAQMDAHLEKAEYTRARILETVWYIKSNQDIANIYEYIDQILSSNDRLIVVEANGAIFRDLLIESESLENSWAG